MLQIGLTVMCVAAGCTTNVQVSTGGRIEPLSAQIALNTTGREVEAHAQGQFNLVLIYCKFHCYFPAVLLDLL